MKKLILLIVVTLLAGCTISRNIVPIKAGVEIEKIYIQRNTKVLMDGFQPELEAQLNNLGFATESYTGEHPQEAVHRMTYQANWAWDMAMYLVYFKGTLYENDKIIGDVEYDARMGGANMNKFGATEDKLKLLLDELFKNVTAKTATKD
jgi:hypothetical protein